MSQFSPPDRPDLSFHLWMVYHFLARSVWIFDYQTSQHEIIVSLIPKKIPPPPRATLWLVWWGWSKYRSHDQLLDCPHDCPHNRPHESPWLITIVRSGQAGGKVLKILKFSIPAPGIRAEDWEMIKDWFQLRNWAAAPIQAQLWAWIFLPKSCFPRNPPILDPLQEILISIMISRGPWSNEGAAIDLENAQDRPVTGAPLLEMWHFVLFIHLERKKSGKYFKCWLQCQKMFFTNLESSYIRDVSKLGWYRISSYSELGYVVRRVQSEKK